MFWNQPWKLNNKNIFQRHFHSTKTITHKIKTWARRKRKIYASINRVKSHYDKKMHLMILLYLKSISWLLFILKKAQTWKVFWWSFQRFACFLKFFKNNSCTIRSWVPMSNGPWNKASCFSLFTMLLLLQLAKHPTPT